MNIGKRFSGLSIENQGPNQKSTRRVVFEIGPRSLLVFNGASQALEFEIPFDRLHFFVGGNRHSILFFEFSNDLNIQFYTDEARLALKQMALIPDLKLRAASELKKTFAHRFELPILFAVVVLLLAWVFVSRNAISSRVAGWVPFSFEQKIGAQLYPRTLTEGQREVAQDLAKLTDLIKPDEADWGHRFVFHVSAETAPNAYATLGGHIFINQGLIQLLRRPEDLLGVLAHEQMHVQGRHVVRGIAQSVGIFSVISILFGDISGGLGVLIENGGPLLSLSYSRALEEEADRNAIRLLTSRQIDPMGLPDALHQIFEHQKKLIAEKPESEVLEKIQKIEILNSHPEIEERIRNLRLQASNGSKKLIRFDFEKFKNRVKEHY